MNTTGIRERFLLRFYYLLVAGCSAAGGIAQAQVTPLFTVNHPLGMQGSYFHNSDLTSFALTRFDPFISFAWDEWPFLTGTPDPSINTDTFSARWTGKIMPMYSENYTFYATTDDGIRVWVNNQLIIDKWFNQTVTEHVSVPIPMTSSVSFDLKVEYFDNTGPAVARVQWSSPSQPRTAVRNPGEEPFGFFAPTPSASIGRSMASIGNGRFVIASPNAHESVSNDFGFSQKGFAWIFDQAGLLQGFASAPLTLDRSGYGRSLSAFADGRFVVGGSYSNGGVVFLQSTNGSLLRSWSSPESSNQAQFGRTLAALPGNRFASAASADKVFIFDAGTVAGPLVVITNPATSSSGFDNFGNVMTALGPDRLLVSDSFDVDGARRYGLSIFDLNGNRIRSIPSPNTNNDFFGGSILAVDDHRFLVGAPYASVSYFTGSAFVTNATAGAVYLFDDTGALLQTFVGPDISRSQYFGSALSLLGPSRVLIGGIYDKVSNISAGRVHLYNIDGVYLASVDNPAPAEDDQFGAGITALDDHRFVIGAPGDDTRYLSAGSIYAYDIPAPSVELGSEIPRPDGIDASGIFVTQGPTVTPSGSAFWHRSSGKLFAVKPGGTLVTWPMQGGSTLNWDGSIGWPTNGSRYQVHITGQSAVDLGDGGVFPNAALLATTTDANALTVSQFRSYTASTPGTSFVMLSSGDPVTNALRFQFIRSVAWNDPNFLHDNAPAVVGQPIVDPAAYHDPACGSPQVLLPGAVFAPAPVFNTATRTGTIIPINRDNPATETDDLVVAYYGHGNKLYDPVSSNAVANNICWPQKPVRFRATWPTNAPKIIIASQQGTGAIDPVQFVNWELYYQNNAALGGFNPNDEHALRRPFGAGEAVFALRDDLATTSTSEPYVLIRYQDPANSLQWRVKVWKVVAEEAPFFFRYPAQAGLLIQAPLPLSALAPSPMTVGVSGPFWRDRKLSFWARAAGNDGGLAEIVMRYFYAVQTDFFFPGGSPPAVGTSVPLLDLRAGTPGTPINVRYDVSWPALVPELRVGETLVKPKNGLPQIDGQSSVEILYQQAGAANGVTSVRLIDPERIRSVPLAQLPSGLSTTLRNGFLFFPTLAPHLEGRVSYDPVAHRLRLAGQFVEPPAGESYLLLNVLTPRDKAALLALSTDVAYRDAVEALALQAASLIEVPPDSAGFDSLALTAGEAQGVGYVTLAFGNSTNLSAPADPISVSVIKVSCPLYRGELKVVESPNPLAEQLTLRHSGDFSGRPDDFQFEWRTLPPVDGLPSSQPPEQWGQFLPSPANGIGALDVTIAGPGLYTLSDNYFVCRYRRVTGVSPCGTDWSAWTSPMLAEGWIKRVLAGINPFEQRITEYQNVQVNTIVSMISQAGARAVGDVALNLDAVNESGLIEVYETVLRRGIGLSIEGAPPVDYGPANDALLLASGRLADLYMLLGNEAYADAADPTIAFGTDDGVYGAQATSLHCFMNQTASLLEEELALLRGRDNSKLPTVQTHPFYNRLIWNFTRDITGGEVAYALNYNLRNVNGDVAGSVNEADARQLYPQGHGDAWGHYLMALKNYYRLLRNTNFTWVPRIEAVIVGGVPVSVDYLDERKFAAAAAARARTGAEVVNLTSRSSYVENAAKPWQAHSDTDTNRNWGLGEWTSRAGQGALFDWVVANATLPDVDTNPSHTGIQKIERGTVREIPEIAEGFRQIQEQADQADGGRNPLGLAENVVPFDIDPSAISAGKTHFDQINERANEALKNAVAVFDHANASTQLLRRQADDANSFQQRTLDSEADFNNRLIEIFGTPYGDDIGPTGTYGTGYNGPDIYHFEYVDSPEVEPSIGPAQTVQFSLVDMSVTSAGGVIKTPVNVTFHISPNGLGLAKPATWTIPRSAPGEIQQARLAALESLRRLQRGVAEYENLIAQIEDTEELFSAAFLVGQTEIIIRSGQLAQTEKLNDQIAASRLTAKNVRKMWNDMQNGYEFAADVLPNLIGPMATDAFAPPRALKRLLGRIVAGTFEDIAQASDLKAMELQDQKLEVAALSELNLTQVNAEFDAMQRLKQLEQLVRQERSARFELAALSTSVQEAIGRHQAAVARGLRLLEERTRFRQQTAAQIQSYRYKDMAFRVFRSDALQKYRAQFDLAARYAYLSAKAYDYETSLAPGDNRGPGSAFLTSIIRSRSLGRFSNGTPLAGNGTGDGGLADPLARMTSNWNLVLKGQLGFNNPQTETGRFSIRNELFRVLSGSTGNQRWRETLSRLVVPNLLELPEFQRHCIPFTPTQPVEPAIVIPFGTTINFGVNFFGWPAGGGDNDYDSTKFATKIRSVGVWFANYNNLGGGMINTPRVYLVPVGLDVMRSPSQGAAYIREWRILDQALPVPFPLDAGTFNDRNWIPINDTLSEDFAAIRRIGRFRAYHDSGSFNVSETITDSRLIGRSVWNTRWLLIIPAGTLHTDRNEGIQRFINGALLGNGTRDGNGVTDIKIFFQTYAYSGN